MDMDRYSVKQKGSVYLFSNGDFSVPTICPPLKSSEQDLRSLTNVFQGELGLNVKKTKHDLTCDEMKKEVSESKSVLKKKKKIFVFHMHVYF